MTDAPMTERREEQTVRTVSERMHSLFGLWAMQRAMAALSAGMREMAAASDATAKALREWGILIDLLDWIAYDRAGAPYGYRRAGLQRWRSEQWWYYS